METATLYFSLMYACQALLAVYGGFQSFVAIQNLRQYETTTKKLAKWSKTVEDQLWNTRKTQGAGAVTTLLCLIVSATLTFASSAMSFSTKLLVSPAMLIAVACGRQYIKSFWNPHDKKDKDGKESVGVQLPLPNMQDYNEAQRRTGNLLETLQYLEYGWLALSLFGFVMPQ